MDGAGGETQFRVRRIRLEDKAHALVVDLRGPSGLLAPVAEFDGPIVQGRIGFGRLGG